MSLNGQDIGLAAADVADPVTVESIDLASQQSESIEDADQKAALAKQYADAKENLVNAAASDKARKQYDQLSDGVIQAANQIETQREQLSLPVDEIDPETPVQQLRQQLAQVTSELNSAEDSAESLTSEPARRQQRITEIPTEIKTLETELAETATQLKQPATVNESEIEAKARNLLLRTKRVAIEKRIAELKAEQNAYVATAEVLAGKRDLAQQTVVRLRGRKERLQTAIALIEDQQAGDQIAQLDRELAITPEPLRSLARRNLELAKAQRASAHQLSEVEKSLSGLLQTLDGVKKTIQSSRDRLDSVGMTDALGFLLRGKLREFRRLQSNYQPDPKFRDQIQQLQVSVFELEDEQTRAQQSLADQLARVAVDQTPDDRPTSQLGLTQTHVRLIGETLATDNKLLQTVLQRETEQQELISRIAEFDDFVDEHVFWLRSAKTFSVSELRDVPVALAWLLKPSHWRELATQYAAGFTKLPAQSVAALLAVVTLFLSRKRLKHLVREESKAARMIHASYASTLRTLLATVGLAAFGPVAIAIAGWWLLRSFQPSPFVYGVASALWATATFIASRELLKEVCRDGGLGESHFGWDDAIRRLVRRHLPWYTVLGGMLVLGSFILHQHPSPNVRTTSERLTNVLMFLVIAVFHHLILRPSSPIYRQLRETLPGSRTDRYRCVTWLLMVGSPLLFASLAMTGYLDTAYRLGRSLQSSVLLLVVVVMTVGMMFRLLSLYRRDTARREAMQQRRRRIEAAQAKAGATELMASEIVDDVQSEEQMDLPTLNRETRQTVMTLAAALTFAGLALIWRDMMPALRILDKIEAWRIGTGDRVDVVSCRDLVFATIGIVATWFAVRKLPGLLELLVLRRSTLDAGAKYALTSIFRYLIIIAGVLFVLGFLAVPWSQLGWLLAAISVGLGFGLQEIVANFVSGIILLIERPVRVGDVITIGGTTGVVSRIQMRSTTVTSWDRKELVVPNKDLVTEKLLNWSLSNVINRLSLTVGVDYDADPDQVKTILDRVVRAHPEVMTDPAPLINLDEFGDSSLNFIVRFYLPNLDNRVSVTHDVNTMIKKALDEAGISIPFPQRDIRVQVDTENLADVMRRPD